MSSTSSLISTTSSNLTDDIPSFAAPDFLDARDRARFERHAARAFRHARKAARKYAAMEASATSMADPVSPIPTLAVIDNVPQVCAFRLVSLAEAQRDTNIRYHGIFN